MGIKVLVLKLLEKGTDYCVSDRDKRRVRTMNAILYCLFFLIFPLVVIYNISVKDYLELMFLFFMISYSLWILKLNQTGKSQLSVIASSLFGTSVIYPLVYFNDTQIGAPYLGLLLAFIAVVLIRDYTWKNLIFVYGFLTYVLTNMFQLMYRSFNLVEHLISIVFILFIFLIFKYVGRLQDNYEKQLEDQNIIIKKQADELIDIQNQKHQQELKIKQNDIEMVVANNSAQVQIKENLVEQLRLAERSNNPVLEIKKIITELKQQIKSQKNISLLQENITDVNAQFLDKLVEVAPNISKTERELCMYLKLGLSTKEIAALKSTTTNTINVTKSRLRNKLGLKTNAEINAFLRNL